MAYFTQQSFPDTTILSLDIGGTNCRLALVKLVAGQFNIAKTETVSTASVGDFKVFLSNRASQWVSGNSAPIDLIAIAPAGPIVDQVCTLTNAGLTIDGPAITRHLGRPVVLINDLSAQAFGIATFGADNPDGLRLIGGAQPKTEFHRRRLIIAPGTGLGAGTLIEQGSTTIVLDMEAGHIDFSPIDPEGAAMRDFLINRTGPSPGYEQFVSGIGLANLAEFWGSRSNQSDHLNSILAQPRSSWPRLVAEAAATDQSCAQIMRHFVDWLAHFASNLAATILPRDGIYLAGGIVKQNWSWLVQDGRFMQVFTRNYLPTVAKLLALIPVWVVTDPNVSLVGAAYGGLLKWKQT